MVVRRVFWSKGEEMKGGLRKQDNEKLPNREAYTSQNIFKVIKPRRMRWVGCY
jgi:hypothetical protein